MGRQMNILIGMILIFLVGYFYGYVAGLDRNIPLRMKTQEILNEILRNINLYFGDAVIPDMPNGFSVRKERFSKTLEQILIAHEGEECNWTREQDDSCMFITSCMQSFFLNDGDTPFQNDMDYCCFCGRKINKLPTPPKEGE